jgi:phospholipid/cholesterol/gamma-HCH transport system substrate-binding protein
VALSKEVKVGLLALVSGAVLYIGFNFLKGVDFLSPTKTYYVMYVNVDGLTVSNPVQLNGLNIGQVDKIKILTKNNNKILVSLKVDEKILLGDSTFAKLSTTDLLGSKSIQLQIGKNTKIFESGDTLMGIKEQAMSELISQKALPIMSNLDSTVIKLNALFGDEMGTSVKNTMHNFELASHDLKLMVSENRTNMGQISANLVSLSNSLKETEKNLSPLLDKMNKFADTLNDLELKAMVNSAKSSMKSLEDITSKINKAEGSLGSLVNDKVLYNNLSAAAKDLDVLFLDIQKHPKRYVSFSVFGGKDKGSKKEKDKAAPAPPAAQSPAQ